MSMEKSNQSLWIARLASYVILVALAPATWAQQPANEGTAIEVQPLRKGVYLLAASPSAPNTVIQVGDDGVLVIHAQRFRTQERNREDARERLMQFIAHGYEVPKPRVATRPTRASKERRLDSKKKAGQLKQQRTRRDWD